MTTTDNSRADALTDATLADARSALYGIAKTYDDSELRAKALEAYEATFSAPVELPAAAASSAQRSTVNDAVQVLEQNWEFATAERLRDAFPVKRQADYTGVRDDSDSVTQSSQPAAAPINQGHGWVNPRPDGAKARCGGPAICHVCQAEAGRLPKVRNEPPPMPTCKPAPSPEDERAAFEARFGVPVEQRRAASAGWYADPWLQAVWRGWQARAAASPAAEAVTDEQRSTINALIELTRATFIALDDSEEREGSDGREHVINSANFDRISAALDRLEELPDDRPGYTLDAGGKAEWALRSILVTAQPARAASANETGAEGALGYAQRLATGLWEKHYRDSAPQWKVLDDTLGVLTQIDNMVCDLSRSPAMAAEAVAWQYRPIINGKLCPWIECTKEAAKRLRADDYRETHEVRDLYAAPQPAQADARVGLMDAVVAAAKTVVREELDSVSVHPCDEHDDEVRARQLPDHMQKLYRALLATPQPEPRAEVTDKLIATAGLLASAVIEYPDFDGDTEHDEPRPLRKIAEDVLADIDAARTGASS
jgi:hypothetical protein